MKFEGLKYPPPENQRVTGARTCEMSDLDLFMFKMGNTTVSPIFCI